jgi:hypothetical protein
MGGLFQTDIHRDVYVRIYVRTDFLYGHRRPEHESVRNTPQRSSGRSGTGLFM